MEQSLSLSREEILYLKKQYKIDHELSELHKWFFDMANQVDINKGDMPTDTHRTWARKYFRKTMLEKVKKHMFCPECIPPHELKQVGEFYEQ